jgi:hypothetical protein
VVVVVETVLTTPQVEQVVQVQVAVVMREPHLMEAQVIKEHFLPQKELMAVMEQTQPQAGKMLVEAAAALVVLVEMLEMQAKAPQVRVLLVQLLVLP